MKILGADGFSGDAAGKSIPAQEISQVTAMGSDRLVSYKSDVTLV